jgi:hypothetical protein
MFGTADYADSTDQKRNQDLRKAEVTQILRLKLLSSVFSTVQLVSIRRRLTQSLNKCLGTVERPSSFCSKKLG